MPKGKNKQAMGNNIVLPYSGHIPGGIHQGIDVVISGRVPHHCKTFSINLCVGPTYQQDCALHFNPRFDDHKVVRNHMQGGQWGPEETSHGLPFHRGMGFEMHMKVTHNGFKITVNHKHFCDFHHRLPKEMIQYIYIEGDVDINNIQFRGKTSPTPAFPTPGYPTGQAYPPAGAPAFPAGQGGYPPVQPPAYPPAPGAGYPPAPGPGYPPAPAPAYPPAPGPPAYPAAGGAGPIYNPPVPFTSGIPMGLNPGKIIFIQGVPNPNCSRFTVNVLCGPSLEAYDVALHFDVRMNYGSDRNVVVRNAKQGGGWGNEEKQITYFPFVPNVPFDMMILTEPSSFKVAVNNQHFVEFFHRIQPLQRANNVSVTGDVRLTQVRFQ